MLLIHIYFVHLEIYIIAIYYMFTSSLDKFKQTSIGHPLIGGEVRIGSPWPNGDGEICLRGRQMFMGYLNDEDKTKACIDEDGCFHIGDIGNMDYDGMFNKVIMIRFPK